MIRFSLESKDPRLALDVFRAWVTHKSWSTENPGCVRTREFCQKDQGFFCSQPLENAVFDQEKKKNNYIEKLHLLQAYESMAMCHRG